MLKSLYNKLVSIGGIIMIILSFPMAFWTQRTIDFWGEKLSGHVVHVPYYLAYMLTVFTNIFGISTNLLSELIRLLI